MHPPKNIAVLGSTGSIGQSSLEVIAGLPERFRPTYLSAHRNTALLAEQVRRFRPRGVVVLDEGHLPALRACVDGATEILAGPDGLREIVGRPDVDVVVNALVGFAGLRPTLDAIAAGKDIALANKETLVVAGGIVMQRARAAGVRILPVDSEHSAILQCMRGESFESVRRLILTASGGPFLHCTPEELGSVTVAQALRHPTWKMGSKITIDSATLMNKGLEVLEAYWLFGLPQERIEVVVHPQSVIHSMVEFADGSLKAQMGVPDMKMPILYALAYPDRPATSYRRIDFSLLKEMTFQKPDPEKFPCLGLAYRALAAGGTAPAVMNAANEVAVRLFLDGNITFPMIPALIANALRLHAPVPNATLEDILRADSDTRAATERLAVIHQEAGHACNS